MRKYQCSFSLLPAVLALAACTLPLIGPASPAGAASIILKTHNGTPTGAAYAGVSLNATLEADPGSPGIEKVRWRVVNHAGEDVTAGFLSGAETPAAVFTAPSDAGAGGFLLEAVAASGETVSVLKSYVRVYSPDNQPPGNSIAAPEFRGNVPLVLKLSCPAFDSDGTIVSRCWEFDLGNEEKQERCVSGDEPYTFQYEVPGRFGIKCVVKDDKGAYGFAAAEALALAEGEPVPAKETNRPPEIHAAYSALPGNGSDDRVALVVKASDPDCDTLAIRWSVPVGKLENADSPLAIWTVPAEAGRYTAAVSVSDGVNEPARHSTTVSVKLEPEEPPAPAVVAEKKKSESAPVTIPTGRLPFEIAVDENQGRAFVTAGGSNSVSVLDTASNKVLAKFMTDGMPRGLAINSFTGRVYVVSAGGSTLNIFDGRTGIEIQDDISTGENNPVRLAVDTRRDVYYVSHSTIASGVVVAMNASSNRPKAAIAVGNGAGGIAVNELTGRVYVANGTDGTVSVIDGDTLSVAATIIVDTGPSEIVVNENTNRVYVSCSDSGTVYVIDGSSDRPLTSLNVGAKPVGMALDAGKDRLYVANKLSGTVSVVNVVSNTVLYEINTGKNPTRLAVDSKQKKLFVILENDDKIAVLDLAE